MSDKVLLFVNQPNPQLICPLCQGVFQTPVIIPCGHTLCQNCAKQANRCPIDKTKFEDKNKLVKNRVIDCQIQELFVRCSNGVKWTGPDTYEIDCHGCPEQIEYRKIEEHEASCAYRYETCRFCNNAQIRSKDMQAHTKHCSRSSRTSTRLTSQNDDFIPEDHFAVNPLTCCSCGLELVKIHQENRELRTLVEKLTERINSLESFQRGSMERISDMFKRYVASVENSRSLCRLQMNQLDLHSHSRENSVAHDSSPRSNASEHSSLVSACMRSSLRRTQSSSDDSWVMPFCFKCIGVMRGHKKAIRDMIVRENFIITASEDCTVKVFDITLLIRGQIGNHIGKGSIATLSAFESEPAVWLHVSSDFSIIFVGSSAGCLKKYRFMNMTEFQLLYELQESEYRDQPELTCGAASSKFVFNGSYREIRVRSAEDLTLVKKMRNLHHWVRALALSRDEQVLASGSHGEVHLWNANDLVLLSTIQHEYGSVYTLALTSTKIIIGTYNRCVHVFDMNTKACISSLLGQLVTNRHVLVTPNERFLLVASNDGSLQIWDLENSLLIQELKRHEDGAFVVGMISNLIFSAGQDAEIKVYKYFKMENMK